MKTFSFIFPQKRVFSVKTINAVAVLACVLILFPVAAQCADVTLAWDANTESDLAGYRLHYGTTSGNYTGSSDVGNVTQYTITNLQDGVTYYFAATAYDTAGNVSSYSSELVHTTGSINNKPNNPTAPNSPSSGSINTSYTFNTSASDPDGDALEYQFDWGDGTSSIWGAASRSHAWSSAGTFCIRARARDSHGALSGWSTCHYITIAIPTYTITATAGAKGSISPSGTVAVNHGSDKTFYISADQNYKVLAVWVDGSSKGAISSYTFNNVTQNHSISASFVANNQTPFADAGSDQTVTEGATVTLNGRNSTDPGGSIVSYLWEQINGSTVLLTNSNTNTATFVAPNVGIAGETLTFRLTVTDDGGLTDVDTCDIDVTKNTIVDSDSDGVPDALDAFPFDPNEWLDTDGDGEGNNTDTDDDNDGMPDTWELLYGLDPLLDDAAADPDGDEVSNINEYNLGTIPNHNEGNFKPDTPIALAPTDGATVSLTPLLETDDFFDPNVNDVHSKTQWVITRAFDNFRVFDVTSETSLTSLSVPNQILEEATDYIWQVRFIDNHSTPSEWSAEQELTTDFADFDLDKNGIPDAQEVAETLDLDEDGTFDIVQSDIKCVIVENGNSQICVSIRNAENAFSIESLAARDPSDPEMDSQSAGKPRFFEFGLLDFKVLVNNPGDETVVTIYLSKAAYAEGSCFKYDPVNDAWLDYAEYTEFSPNRKQVYLTLKDGGFGDADGIENGIIVDPLAFGSESNPNGGGSDDSPIEDVMDSLGCFISTAAMQPDNPQTWNLWHEVRGREPAIVLVAILLVLAAKAVWRRRIG